MLEDEFKRFPSEMLNYGRSPKEEIIFVSQNNVALSLSNDLIEQEKMPKKKEGIDD